MHHSNFVHLHLHTQYSLLDGAIRLDDLFAKAKEYKMPALAMTDHGNIFGAVDFYTKAQKAGIKPIIGCEVYVAPKSRFDKASAGEGGGRDASYHLILLIKNAIGYKNLCKMLTLAHLEGFYYKPRIDKELLKDHNEGLIALSSCLHGEIPHLIGIGSMDKAVDAAQWFKEIFTNKRFYLELQHNNLQEQDNVNKGILEISKGLGIPVAATNDCHYLKKEDAHAHEILLCIQTGKTINSKDRMRFNTDDLYFKSPEEMAASFKDIPEAIRNTIEIAERCNLELKLGEHHLPHFPVPEGETLDSFTEKKAWLGLEERLKSLGIGNDTSASSPKWQYYERLERELKTIKGMGFSGYFLIVADFINYARQRHIPVGPGRGSSAGSLAAYALKITNLDPIKNNLLFERFLNPDRISLPDIDVDLCYEGRDEVIRYVTEKYGKENVSQIITFGQMKAKAVIRDVGRAMDIPYNEVDKIAKLVPNVLDITLEDSLKQEPKLKEITAKDSRVKELIDTAFVLEGLPRHASTHAAGVVIANKPIIEYMPLYKSQKEEVITTQYDMDGVTKMGLVKFDLLGLKTLTVIYKTIKLVQKNRDIVIDIDAVKLDDADTYKLIGAGRTDGIFQMESSGMKDVLIKFKPETFEDITAVIAIYRPGPLQSGMVDDFIKRKHGKTPIRYEHPLLKEILENTYGVMVYQEQVMQIAATLAGFTPGDADVLRKAMGKKLPAEMVHQRERFIEGAKKNKIPQKTAEKIFDLMANFAGYGFNKSHSAVYALLAFQTAYLKRRYPQEFMAALLTSDMGNTEKVIKYIAECKTLGIEILPPDINESSMDFTVTEKQIRFGLAAVKNVGGAAIEVIIDTRKRDGRFNSIFDFLERVDMRKVNKKVIESLIKCGAFDSTGAKRGVLFQNLDRIMAMAQTAQADRISGQIGMFTSVHEPSLKSLPEAEEWHENELLAHEKEALGFYITGHPLARFDEEIRLYTNADTETALEKKDGEVVRLGGVAISKSEKTTKKGDRMAFVTLEDLKGFIEVVVFADLYKNASGYFASDIPILVRGRIDRQEEKIKLVAEEVYPIDEARERLTKAVHLVISTIGIDSSQMADIKALLKKYSGKCPVFCHFKYPDGKETVLALPDDLKVNPTMEMIDDTRHLVGENGIFLN